MDVKTADATLSILEAHHYSGVISAHSWDSPEENPRIYNLGGFVTPIAGASPAAFVSQWRDSLTVRNKRFYSGAGFGYGADMNGLAQESQPTSGDPIRYPFNSYDGRVTFTREQWGQRVFDLNTRCGSARSACRPRGRGRYDRADRDRAARSWATSEPRDCPERLAACGAVQLVPPPAARPQHPRLGVLAVPALEGRARALPEIPAAAGDRLRRLRAADPTAAAADPGRSGCCRPAPARASR